MIHAYHFATKIDTGNIALQMTLYVIAMHVNVETGRTFVGVKTLMEEARVKSDRTMRNYIAELEDMGVIRRERRKRPDGARSTDNIELVGFSDWYRQHKEETKVVYGARGKVVESAAKFTGAPGKQATGGSGRYATGLNNKSNKEYNSFQKKELSGVPRDTSIPFAEYKRDMIAKGLYKDRA